MSNTGDVLNSLGKLNGGAALDSAAGVELIGNSLGFLADLSGAIGFVSLAQTTIQSLLGQDDQVTSMLEQLQAEVAKLEADRKLKTFCSA